MTDHLSPERRSENMRRVRSKNSLPEMAVRKLVHGLGYRYRLHAKDLPGKPDLVFPSRRCILFVHGCFWHGHENCRKAQKPATNQQFWVAKLEKNYERDRLNLRALRRLGWRVMVVWECQTENLNKLTPKLCRFLK